MGGRETEREQTREKERERETLAELTVMGLTSVGPPGGPGLLALRYCACSLGRLVRTASIPESSRSLVPMKHK